MAKPTQAGNTAVARSAASSAQCYATLGANRVRAIYDEAVQAIQGKRDPVGHILAEYDAAVKQGKAVDFLARIHSILDNVAARLNGPQGAAGGNTFNINQLMVAAMKQVGEKPSSAPILDAEAIGVQSGASDTQDVEW